MALAMGTGFAQQASLGPSVALDTQRVRPDRLRVDSTLVMVPVEVSDGIGRAGQRTGRAEFSRLR